MKSLHRHVKNTKFSLDPMQIFCFLYESRFSFWGQLESEMRKVCEPFQRIQLFVRRTCTIIIRGLYFFNPLFEDYFFIFEGVILENSALMYG